MFKPFKRERQAVINTAMTVEARIETAVRCALILALCMSAVMFMAALSMLGGK